MKRTIFVLLLAAVAATAQTQPAPPMPSVADLKFPPLRPIAIPPVATFTLPNGMKVFLLEDHELPMISGTALVHTGNLFDPPEKIGLADITGSVMRTGGTKDKTGEEWNRELENMAAVVESGIGESSGSVTFQTLKEDIDPVMAIFRDVLTAPEFRQGNIDLAKMQERSGIARRNDDASGIADREFNNIVYGRKTPYGWQEQYATIAAITRDDLVRFHQRYYFPKNTLLGVWGDFDSAAMRAKLEQVFAGWTAERDPVPPFPAVSSAPAPGIYLAVKPDVTQTFFALGHLGGELRDKDYPALEVMAAILGGGFQSRLFQRVRTQMGDAYNIGAGWQAAYDHPGLFKIEGSTKSPATVETIQAVMEEVKRICSEQVGEAELKTAKETALNSLVFAFDTKAKTLRRMLTYQYYGYPQDFIQQYQKALAAVTRADVLRVARQHIDLAGFTVVTAGNPETFGKPLDTLGSPVHQIDLSIPEAGQGAPAGAGTPGR